MSERIRYALYYTPSPGSALAAFGDDVLGEGRWFGSSGLAGSLPSVTASPRVYGFHATLKAPMRLAPGVAEDDLLVAAADLARHRAPISIGRLRVARIGGFLALVPVEAPPALGLFAAECVAALDPLRAPLTETERLRRRPERLDARERMLLDRWGYPHVFETFRFHMTLTGRLAPEVQDRWHAEFTRAYDAEPIIVIDAVTVMRQEGDHPFHALRRIALDP